MTWINVVGLNEATGYLKELYQKYFIKTGYEDNLLMSQSLNPKSLRLHYELHSHLMRGRSELSRIQREMIAVVVSAVNHCHY